MDQLSGALQWDPGVNYSRGPDSFSSSSGLAEFVQDGIRSSRLSEIINGRPHVGELVGRDVVKMAGEPSDVILKTGAIQREAPDESITLDRSPALGKELDDLDLGGLQEWLKALCKNISLRFKLRRSRRLLMQQLIRRRNLLREIRILRVKVALLDDPSDARTDLAIMSAEPSPNSGSHSANPAGQRLPMFGDPLNHGDASFGLLGGEMLDGNPNANRDQTQNPSDWTESEEKERDKSQHQLDRKK